MTDRALLAEGDEPPPRRRRPWLVGLALLIALLIGLWLALPDLAGAYLRAQLAAAGLPSPRLVVTSLGLHQATIVGLQLGTDDEVAVAQAVARYDPGALLHGRIRRLELSGIHIKASLDGGRLSLGSLDGALGRGGGSGGDILPTELSIGNGVLSLKLPDGLLAASFAGEFDRGADSRFTGQLGLGGSLAVGDFGAQLSGRLEGALALTGLPALSLQLDLADPHYGDAHFAAGQLKLVTEAAGGSVELHLGSPGDPFEVTATGRLSVAADRLALTAHAALAAQPGAPVWALLPLPPPQTGVMTLTADLAGAVPQPGLDWRRVDWTGAATASLDQVGWPGLATNATGKMRLALAGQGPAVTVSLPEDLHLEAAIDAEPLQTMPVVLRTLLAGRLAATLRSDSRIAFAPGAATPLTVDLAGDLAHGPATITYHIKGSTDLSGFKGDLSTTIAGSQLEFGPFTAGALAIDLGGALAVNRDGATLRLGDGHGITAQRLAFGGSTARLDGLALAMRPTPEPLLSVSWSQPGGLQLRHNLALGPGKLSGLRLGALSQGPLSVSWQGLTSSGGTTGAGYGATGTLAGGSLTLPQGHLAASDIAATATLTAEGAVQATLQGARLVDPSHSPIFVPLRLQGTAALAAGRLDAKATLADGSGRLRLDVAAHHDLAAGSGAATLSSRPLVFVAGGLQPRDLSPAYGRSLQEVTGSLDAGGSISWGSGGYSSNIKLALRDVSGRTPDLALQRLNGVIIFDGISPPTTPPHQQLAAALADIGLPLTDALVDFQLRPGPELAIASGSLKLAGGDVALDPVRIGKGAPVLRLKVRSLDLQQLLALASVDGLDGTGTLSGEIPVTLDPAGIRVTGGQLTAAGPGRLSYAPGKPPAALQGGGESVSLALAALTDFRYDALRVTLDREAGGEIRIGMHVRGKNPSFYNGYPVELNFTLSGALDRILRRGLAGYRIPDSIRKKLSTFGE